MGQQNQKIAKRTEKGLVYAVHICVFAESVLEKAFSNSVCFGEGQSDLSAKLGSYLKRKKQVHVGATFETDFGNFKVASQFPSSVRGPLAKNAEISYHIAKASFRPIQNLEIACLPGFQGDIVKNIKKSGGKFLSRNEVILTSQGPVLVQGMNHDLNQLAGKLKKKSHPGVQLEVLPEARQIDLQVLGMDESVQENQLQQKLNKYLALPVYHGQEAVFAAQELSVLQQSEVRVIFTFPDEAIKLARAFVAPDTKINVSLIGNKREYKSLKTHIAQELVSLENIYEELFFEREDHHIQASGEFQYSMRKIAQRKFEAMNARVLRKQLSVNLVRTEVQGVSPNEEVKVEKRRQTLMQNYRNWAPDCVSAFSSESISHVDSVLTQNTLDDQHNSYKNNIVGPAKACAFCKNELKKRTLPFEMPPRRSNSVKCLRRSDQKCPLCKVQI